MVLSCYGAKGDANFWNCNCCTRHFVAVVTEVTSQEVACTFLSTHILSVICYLTRETDTGLGGSVSWVPMGGNQTKKRLLSFNQVPKTPWVVSLFLTHISEGPLPFWSWVLTTPARWNTKVKTASPPCMMLFHPFHPPPEMFPISKHKQSSASHLSHLQLSSCAGELEGWFPP